MIEVWVKEALSHANMKQAELARRLTVRLKRDIDRAAVNKMCKLGGRKVSADEMIAIEEITGYPAPLENADGITKVPLIESLVSAGNLSPREPIKPEDVTRYIIGSDLPPGDWFAVEVEGDSMNLVSPEGSVILVNRADAHLVDGAFYVVAFESDEQTTYKRFRQAPDYFAPYTTNPEHGPIMADVPYRVVGRVSRTMLDVGPGAKRRLK